MKDWSVLLKVYAQVRASSIGAAFRSSHSSRVHEFVDEPAPERVARSDECASIKRAAQLTATQLRRFIQMTEGAIRRID